MLTRSIIDAWLHEVTLDLNMSWGPKKGLFTWKEDAPANRATRLEGLKHNPPLHATHLTETVSRLRELFPERPLSTINITAHQGNVFPSYISASC